MITTGSYDVISQFYDEAVGCRDGRAENVRRALEKYHPSAKTLLELGCGTGLVLEQLADRYDVSGLDASAGMLNVAKRRLPTVQLYQLDMSGFKIAETFDAIICIYDSLNHLRNFASWQKTFELAKEHLNDGGVFLFDINTQRKLEKLAAHSSSWPKFDEDYDTPISRLFGMHQMLVKITKEEGESTRWDIRFYQHREAADYRLWTDSFHEVSYPIETVMGSLMSNFRTVDAWDEQGNDITNESLRVYFCCGK